MVQTPTWNIYNERTQAYGGIVCCLFVGKFTLIIGVFYICRETCTDYSGSISDMVAPANRVRVQSIVWIYIYWFEGRIAVIWVFYVLGFMWEYIYHPLVEIFITYF